MGNKIIAVVGMCGSGKSEITKFFVELGYFRIYFGDLTIKEIKKQGLEINEPNEKYIREKLREELGLSAYALQLLPDICKAAASCNVVLDGLYSWSEYKYLKKHFGNDLVILAVVTNQQIRIKRLITRPVRPLNTNDVERRDAAEIENLEKGGPIAKADYYILNNCTRKELKKQWKGFIKWLHCQK
jgi:dephospho-CoA kinase